MPVSVDHNARTEPDALESELRDAGMHVMRLDVPPVMNTSHWHTFDSRFYILSGHLTLSDAESGQVYECAPGTQVNVPARALHHEHSSTGYSIVLGTSVAAEDFGDPVDRPPGQL